MLHGHLILDDQVDLDEQTMQVRLPRDVARTLLTRGEWDLEFGVRGPARRSVAQCPRIPCRLARDDDPSSSQVERMALIGIELPTQHRGGF